MTTTTNDPWAAAQVNHAQPAGQQQGRSEPVNRAADEAALNPNADPFATESTTGGGGGIRGPQWPDLLDRLVVLRPVTKMLDQPVPNQPNQTQDFYACDLTVLDGGTLTVVTPAREAQGNNPALPEQSNDYEPPFTFPRWYAYGRAITVKLDALKAPLFLGVVKRCPTGPGYRAGKTWKDATREWDEYVRKIQSDPARAGAKPQFSWGLIDPTEEQRKFALDWYRAQQQQG